ncbi:MAG: FAD-dependent oxidoreductase [Bacilli bacterium]|nr:FAD-dependent oxidoreductase [Bacilli bacterium]
MLNFDSIIIGSGVAGMTAAIYLKRANLNILLIEKNIPGGQINRSSRIENYPGFKEIDGPTLAMNVYEQVNNLNIQYQYDEVKEIIKQEDLFLVKTKSQEYLTKTIILATGRSAKELGIDKEKQLVGRGISFCALCDGFFYKEKEVAIVGGGNSALEEALYLSDICKKVTIILRSKKFRASEMFQDKIKEKTNIEVLYNTQIASLEEENDRLSGIILDNGDRLNVGGLFIYIGSNPDSEVAKNLNVTTDNGYIIVDEKMKTNVNGVFACGDVIKKDVYQLATSIGEGATASNSVISYLSGIK